MVKVRPTQSFKDAIADARRIFGTDDNNVTQIVKKALRFHANKPFEYSKPSDKSVGNPITLKLESDVTGKDLQGLVIEYIRIKIEQSASRRQVPLVLDESDNYIIKEK